MGQFCKNSKCFEIFSLIGLRFHSSFNSNSAAGSFIALYTNAAKITCIVMMAAVAPITVEPCDR